MDIVKVSEGHPVTDTLLVSKGTENSHEAVIKLVRRYTNDLEEFGPIRFEIQKGSALPQGGFAKSTEYAILNEPQTTLLFTYMRNTPIVREFKKRLVKEFYEMAGTIRQIEAHYNAALQSLENRVAQLEAKPKSLPKPNRQKLAELYNEEWRPIIEQWIGDRQPTTVEVLEQALNIQEWTRGDQVRVGAIMADLGYFRRRTSVQPRKWRYFKLKTRRKS